MDSVSQRDRYSLGRDVSDSIRSVSSQMLSSFNCYLQDIRLDAQHLLWRMHLGYILHPQIPITKGMKTAELGTGTGYAFTPTSSLPNFPTRSITRLYWLALHRVWILDAATCLPSTVELHGYDISNYQYPSRKFWPRNFRLGVLDSLTDPPPQLVGQYDVVHLRMWASNLKGNDTSPVMEHVKKLLSKWVSGWDDCLCRSCLITSIEPGGYVQWEDADLVNQAVSGEEAEKLLRWWKRFSRKLGFNTSELSHSSNRRRNFLNRWLY